jgi:hypothetical protein
MNIKLRDALNRIASKSKENVIGFSYSSDVLNLSLCIGVEIEVKDESFCLWGQDGSISAPIEISFYNADVKEFSYRTAEEAEDLDPETNWTVEHLIVMLKDNSSFVLYVE